MSWQVRDGHEYYYLTRRKNGRRQTVYFGRGPMAELAAADVDAAKLDREQLSEEVCMARDRLRSLDRSDSRGRSGCQDAARGGAAE